MKKPFASFGFSLLILVQGALAAGPTIPQRPPPDNFQKLTEDWPFALATPPVAPAATPEIPWASNLYVGGIGKTYESGKEEVFVAVKMKNGEAGFSLYGNQPNGDDISVAGIEWSDIILKSRVTLKKGPEFATIQFDAAAVQATPQPAAPAPRAGMPIPGGKGPPIARPPGAVVPRPTNIPQPAAAPLPSNTNAAPANPAVPANPAPNAPNAPRQRVRVIQSTP